MPLATALVSAALPALLAGTALGVWAGRGWGRRRGARGAGEGSGERPAGARPGMGDATVSLDLLRLRASALDVAAEALLIVGADGDVLDCNAAALTLLDRHRSAVVGVPAASLRTLRLDGAAVEWGSVVAGRAPWSGEALVRLPDGSHLPREVRLVPVFGDTGEVRAMVEACTHAGGAGGDGSDELRRYLESLAEDEAAYEDEAGGADPAAEAARELQRLALGVAALDRVVQQYEHLIAAMRAEDPLTEALAGLVAETREVAALADVARLRRELPRTVERLRRQLQQEAERMTPGAHAPR